MARRARCRPGRWTTCWARCERSTWSEVRRKVVSVDEVALGCRRPHPPTAARRLQPDIDAPLSIETYLRAVAARAGVRIDGRCSAAGGRRAGRDTGRLRAGLRRADASQSRPLHGVARVRGLRGAFSLSPSQPLRRARLSGGPRLVLQDFRLVEHEGVGDAVVRSVLSWAGGGLRSWYLPGDHSLPHNDVAPSGRESQSSIRLRVASGQGLAAGVGRRVVLVLEGRATCRRNSTPCGSSTSGRNRLTS